MSNQVTYSSGWGNEALPFVIPNGATGSAVAPVNFGRPYWGIIIKCEDVSGCVGKTMSLYVAYSDGDDTLVLLQNADLGSAWESDAIAEAFGGMVLAASGAQQLRIVLDGVTTAETTFTIIGVDPGRGEGL